MQVYQNHVVFQSFSDLYFIEKRKEQIREQKQQSRKVVLSLSSRADTAASSSSSSSSASRDSSPASSRAPSLLFHNNELTRTSSTKSNASSTATSVRGDFDDEEQHQYPAGLFNSHVERRLKAKEADLATLYDEPMAMSHVEEQGLSLRRFS